jgi:hypothetical protein
MSLPPARIDHLHHPTQVDSSSMEHPETSLRNDAVDWSDFDADEYWKFNFSTVLPDDRQIIETASKFLITACETPRRGKTAVDVDAGTNLYPSLLMLPWAEIVVPTGYAAENIYCLTENLTKTSGDWRWQPFWDLVSRPALHQEIAAPWDWLAKRHGERHPSNFDPLRCNWGLGSMFFMTDGITDDPVEFKARMRRLLTALKPGAPFLLALMEGFTGYELQGVSFPPGVFLLPQAGSGFLAASTRAQAATPWRTPHSRLLAESGSSMRKRLADFTLECAMVLAAGRGGVYVHREARGPGWPVAPMPFYGRLPLGRPEQAGAAV